MITPSDRTTRSDTTAQRQPDFSRTSVIPKFLDHARSQQSTPLTGSGHTAERFAVLRVAAADDPSLGRLIESHEDALAIHTEAGRDVPRGAALAVWAAESRGGLVLHRSGSGFRVVGTKGFCGGASVVDAALVTVAWTDAGPDGSSPTSLVLVPVRDAGVRVHPNEWRQPAFAEADVCSVELDLEIGADRLIGPPGFYTDRPGVWQGAVGVAAVWAGIGDALVAGPASDATTSWRAWLVVRSPRCAGASTPPWPTPRRASTARRWNPRSTSPPQPAT